MNRKRSHWLAIGLLFATSVAGIALGTASLAGFSNASAGDLDVSSACSATNLLIVLLGTATLAGLELARMAGRRTGRSARQLRVTGAAPI